MCIVFIYHRIYYSNIWILILLTLLSFMWAFCNVQFTKLINDDIIVALFSLRIFYILSGAMNELIFQ